MLRIGLAADLYFSGLGKLKNYQLKLNTDESITHVAQPVRRISFSRREEFVQKVKELEDLDVIEMVDGPITWLNP